MSNPRRDESPDVQVIWLQPRCCDEGEHGRVWCSDPQEPCEECGAKWVKFIRVDVLEQLLGTSTTQIKPI